MQQMYTKPETGQIKAIISDIALTRDNFRIIQTIAYKNWPKFSMIYNCNRFVYL